jgi:predicted nucleic acid-binding protein
VMQILLDTNVLLDFLLNRQPGKAAASAIVRANNKGIFTGYLAAFSFPTIYYFSYKHYDVKYDSNQARQRAWGDVKTSLNQFNICPVSRQTLDAATKMPGRDFEDNLQIACALAEGLDAIVTSNIKDFRSAGITLYTPTQLVKRLKLR